MKLVESGFRRVRTECDRFHSYLIQHGAARMAMLGGLCVGSYLFFAHFIINSVKVVGASMTPTLCDGDTRILHRWALLYREPRPGEMVVLKDPRHHDFAVKRIIAGPRDIVLVREGIVYVNGKKLAEPYLSPRSRTDCGDLPQHVFEVRKNEYFVLGDNRQNSEDSRSYGAVPKDCILGLIQL